MDKAHRKMKPDQDLYGKAFGNITWNLRSSMGCGLVFQNELVESYFPMGTGDEGRGKGLDLLNELAAETEEEICVIVVAGDTTLNLYKTKASM